MKEKGEGKMDWGGRKEGEKVYQKRKKAQYVQRELTVHTDLHISYMYTHTKDIYTYMCTLGRTLIQQEFQALRSPPIEKTD